MGKHIQSCRYIERKLVKARDTVQALAVLKKVYPRARIITYSFYKYIYEVPREERSAIYRNRHMWVWFIKDVDKMKQEVQ